MECRECTAVVCMYDLRAYSDETHVLQATDSMISRPLTFLINFSVFLSQQKLIAKKKWQWQMVQYQAKMYVSWPYSFLSFIQLGPRVPVTFPIASPPQPQKC